MRRKIIRGGVNILAGLAAHIPCCGVQILFGMLGLHVVGGITISLLQHYRYVMPLFISGALTIFYMYFIKQDCKGPKLNTADIIKFTLLNLCIGYAVFLLIYLFVPPRDYMLIRGPAQVRMDMPHHVAEFIYDDAARTWPWRRRYFTAHLDQIAGYDLQAPIYRIHEMPWYRAMLKNDFGASRAEGRIFTNFTSRPTAVCIAHRSNLKNLPVYVYGTMGRAYAPQK